MSQDSQGDREVQGSYLAWFAGAALIATVALVIAVIALFLPTDGGGSGGGGGTASGGGGGTAAAGDATAGQEAFNATCATCHGTDAQNPTVGKDLVANTFVADTAEADLVAFVKAGRGADDPANTTGVAMPANGGNPALEDEDLANIVAYLKTLQG